MKNFFKNLFGKKYPQRNNDQEPGMRRVYAGPLSRKKRMQCVYAGPGMMPKDRVKEKDKDNMREVYAGPPRSDKDETMECVYMGPPVDEDVIIEEINPLEGVYMGPAVNATGVIEEEDVPMEDVYMGPEPEEDVFNDEEDTPMEDVYMGPESPDTDEPVEDAGSQYSGPSEEPIMKPVYAGPFPMNMGPQNDPFMMSAYAGPVSMNTDTKNISPMIMAYAGPANIGTPIGIMTNSVTDGDERKEITTEAADLEANEQPSMMMVYWGPAGPQNSYFNGLNDMSEKFTKSKPPVFCLNCGSTDIDPNGRICKKCGAVLDSINADMETVYDPGSAAKNPDDCKFCPTCGAMLAPGAPFCSECGTKT